MFNEITGGACFCQLIHAFVVEVAAAARDADALAEQREVEPFADVAGVEVDEAVNAVAVALDGAREVHGVDERRGGVGVHPVRTMLRPLPPGQAWLIYDGGGSTCS